MQREAAQFSGAESSTFNACGPRAYLDFLLHYDYGPFNSSSFPARPPVSVSFFTALQEQLGLKLEPTREVMDALVIDSVKRPTPD